LWQIAAISSTESTLVVEVVPTVATTAHGRCPSARSLSISASSAAGTIRYSASVATRTTFSSPMPSVIAALSIELCASADV
jgi:hypothetical protein